MGLDESERDGDFRGLIELHAENYMSFKNVWCVCLYI